jgi:hypothetical protein
MLRLTKEVEAVEKLAKEAGVEWHRGQHPKQQLKALAGAFYELARLKNAVRSRALIPVGD